MNRHSHSYSPCRHPGNATRTKTGQAVSVCSSDWTGRQLHLTPCTHIILHWAAPACKGDIPVPSAHRLDGLTQLSIAFMLVWQVVIVTGSNKGLGKEAARVLASRGAEVIIAVRDTTRGEAAAKDIRAQHADAKVCLCIDAVPMGAAWLCSAGNTSSFCVLHDVLQLANLVPAEILGRKSEGQLQLGRRLYTHNG